VFEEYLEDAFSFAEEAKKLENESEVKRFDRASIFCTISAIEAFVCFIGETLAKAESKEKEYEVAFLTDRKFGVNGAKFEILDQAEFVRLEEKLRFLLKKYAPQYDISKEAGWSRFLEFKRFRDSLVHPHEMDENDILTEEYAKQIKLGMASTIEIINNICKGVFKRSLRQKILDMTM
jgi:hypothetical protein